MKNCLIAIFFIFLSLGCSSTKYLGISDAQFGDGNPGNSAITLKTTGTGITESFKQELERNLLASGFNDAQGDMDSKGYLVDVQQNSIVENDGWSLVLYIFSLCTLPSRVDITNTYDVNIYKDGQVIRTSSYQCKKSVYTTAYSPVGLFMGESSANAEAREAFDLADKISVDFPVGRRR